MSGDMDIDRHLRAKIADLTEECKTLRGQLRTLGLWIGEALPTLDTVEPEESTEAELLTALIRRGEMLVLASLARSDATLVLPPTIGE